jgi:transposase
LTRCVRTPEDGGGRASETRTFRTMTRSLELMRDWLVACGVTLVGDGVDLDVLEAGVLHAEDGMGVGLLNAYHLKAVPGRKTDVRDAGWIAQLMEMGLVRPSFVPPPAVRRLRNLTRYRLAVMHDRTRDGARIEKLLEDASIKLSAVASSITGASARAMLAQLVAGKTDTAAMADLAKSKLRRKVPDLVEALTGRFDDHHALLVSVLLASIEDAEATLARLDAALEVEMAPWAEQVELLQTMLGIAVRAVHTIIAETGGGMLRFPTAGALASWPRVVSGAE